MKATLYSKTGTKKKDIELPQVFETTYRPDLIRRAHRAFIASQVQPKGANPLAGKRTTAESWGKGSGMSRVRRIKAGPMRKGRGARKYRGKHGSFHAAGRAAFSPGMVGGRRAHPPKAEKIITKKINIKEKKMAIMSAIAATANKELVLSRGHKADKVQSFPLVVEDDFAKISKSKEALTALEKLGLTEDIVRCKDKKIRAGRGKMRGRKYKQRKGPLFVLPKDAADSSFRNFAGADVAKTNSLNIEHLSPGAHGARLVLWTEGAIKELEARSK
ncbi:50S ribosomal protein L4 [Candidatus Undinarchaeota archaeon]